MAGAAGAVLAFFALVYAVAFMDWYQFGDATPPESVPPVESSAAQLTELLVNTSDAMQSEVEIVADSRVNLEGSVKLKTDPWRWPEGYLRGRPSSERLERARERARLPVPELRIDLVCRARNQSGERVVSRGICHLQREKEELASWGTNFVITPRSGTYHLRIWLCRRFPEEARTVEPEKLLLGSFPVRLVPD